MMKTIDIIVSVALALAAARANCAEDEKTVLGELQRQYPETHFSSVSKTPVAGIYEVVMGSNVVYVGSDTRYFLFGRLVDVHKMLDLTAPKLTAAAPREANDLGVSFADLPLKDAIKTVRGNGARLLAVFSDPVCPYCKLLEPELAKLDNVTIHTFLVPFQGNAKPLAIWCARNPAEAWSSYMLSGDESRLAPDVACENPLQRNLALAGRLHVRGTPTLIAHDGRIRVGTASVAELDAWLLADSGRLGVHGEMNLESRR
jgi:thiol:disulfide interchange protein DsbC